MAKQVPYKCRFGHITIVYFHSYMPTLGTVECEECSKLAGTEIRIVTNTNKICNYSSSVVRRGEKAVRI